MGRVEVAQGLGGGGDEISAIFFLDGTDARNTLLLRDLPRHAGRRLPCRVEWQPGFRLSVEELRRHPGYRGQEYVDLGAEIAVDGRIDPRIIGDAVRSGRYDPQDLKKVWHCLARFGPSLRVESQAGNRRAGFRRP